MADKIKIFEVELPAHLDLSYETASDEDNIRRFVGHKARRILPGDIEIVVQPQISGGWFVEVWEQPNLPEDNTAR